MSQTILKQTVSKEEVKMQHKKIYQRPSTLNEETTIYCGGCGHGIIHKLIAQAIEQLKIISKTIMIAPVGCSVLLYKYLNVDGIEAAHGRAPAIATGIKRVQPDRVVVSYQGDGDLISIGATETIHAANRGENISVIFVNNGVYGMTGGQLAPTTLMGQITATTPKGREEGMGAPIRVCELLNTLQAPHYIARCSVHDIANIRKTRQAITKVLRNQIDKKGYSFLEILSMCPTGWGVDPVKATQWIKDRVQETFPLGVFRDGGEIVQT